jgi:TatD DNase family protein
VSDNRVTAMLIDSHCHLPHKAYTKPVEEIVDDADLAGVTKLISVGTSLTDNVRANDTAQKFENVFSTVAIYPHDDMRVPIEDLRLGLVRQLDSFKKVVAVGECGFDVTDWKGGRTPEEQRELFEMQLDLAVDRNMPVIIHNRNGGDVVFSILDQYLKCGLRGVVHCFSEDWEAAKKFLDRGLYLGFTGMITYKSRSELREVVKLIPEDRFLVETDAPYLPPEGFRGQVNEPKYVVEVAKKIAEVRGISFDKVSELSYSGTCRLFGIK